VLDNVHYVRADKQNLPPHCQPTCRDRQCGRGLAFGLEARDSKAWLRGYHHVFFIMNFI
jgi:hypothetical protein